MWSIEVAAIQAQVDFEAEMECSLMIFLIRAMRQEQTLQILGGYIRRLRIYRKKKK